MKNWITALLFIAYVKIPLMEAKRYTATKVAAFEQGTHYTLTLEDGSTVMVPVMFTIIEEKK